MNKNKKVYFTYCNTISAILKPNYRMQNAVIHTQRPGGTSLAMVLPEEVKRN